MPTVNSSEPSVTSTLQHLLDHKWSESKLYLILCGSSMSYLIYYADQLPILLQDIGEWWGAHPQEKKEVQVDIVALGAKPDNAGSGRRFLIGSCKFKNEPIGTDELDLLREYASLFTTSEDECFYYIFSKSAFTSGLQEKQRLGEVTLISLEEVYRKRESNCASTQ